ncbi:hypothetical protein C8R46DRAFT_1106821 [Mycena filopes]|nr:hypothetical protein C8R46DRAFT_1106821 [Mycena filopes]
MNVETEPSHCHSDSIQHRSNLRLENARSPKELLIAVQDVVLALKQLFAQHQILHKHITYDNISVRNDSEGVKGVIIDLDFPDPTEGSSRNPIGLGLCDSLAFQPVKRVSKIPFERLAEHEHTLQHDLESLFYVLCWACYGYDHTGRLEKYRPNWMEEWITTRWAQDAISNRKSFLSTPISWHVNRYMGCQRDIMELVIELLRRDLQSNASDPEEACTGFLRIVEKGIERMGEERCGSTTECTKVLATSATLAETKRD